MTATTVFAALGDPTRHRLLQLLAQQPESSSASLAAALTVTRQAVEKQLQVLVRAELVALRREGRRVRYRLRSHQLQHSADWLQALAREWDHQLGLVKRAAETPLG